MNADQPNPPESNPGYRPRRIPAGSYTQVNIVFPSAQVELPSPDKFKAFPPDAQKVILDAFQNETAQRHEWIRSQQANDHELNLASESHYFAWRMTGTIGGAILSISLLVGGIWLVKNGASAIGAASMLLSISTVVLAAIYGRSVTLPKLGKAEAENKEERHHG